MLSRVFQAQLRRPSKGDWCEIVKEDLQDFGIKFTFEEIRNMKPDMFKKKVNLACREYSFKKLLKEKGKHSKGSQVKYVEFEIQSYLKSDKITTKQAKLLFKIRSNMLDVRSNYESKYVRKGESDDTKLLCQLCKVHRDTERNIFQCTELGNMSDISFDDIYSKNMDKLAKAVTLFQKLWKIRKNKML